MPAGDVGKVEAYLAKVPAPQRRALEALRRQIRSAAPQAQEGFGYGLPGFYQDGPLFYYGAAKGHCALYGARPPGFEEALAAYEASKGTVRFDPAAPLPAALVRRLVKARLAENRQASAGKPKRAAARKGASRPTPK